MTTTSPPGTKKEPASSRAGQNGRQLHLALATPRPAAQVQTAPVWEPITFAKRHAEPLDDFRALTKLVEQGRYEPHPAPATCCFYSLFADSLHPFVRDYESNRIGVVLQPTSRELGDAIQACLFDTGQPKLFVHNHRVRLLVEARQPEETK
jgi:hypothetical protein